MDLGYYKLNDLQRVQNISDNLNSNLVTIFLCIIGLYVIVSLVIYRYKVEYLKEIDECIKKWENSKKFE